MAKNKRRRRELFMSAKYLSNSDKFIVLVLNVQL